MNFSFKDGYTANDVLYEWKNVDVPIADEAKEHLHNEGWKVVHLEKKEALYELTTGRISIFLMHDESFLKREQGWFVKNQSVESQFVDVKIVKWNLSKGN